jgi:hypothetical protein
LEIGHDPSKADSESNNSLINDETSCGETFSDDPPPGNYFSCNYFSCNYFSGECIAQECTPNDRIASKDC